MINWHDNGLESITYDDVILRPQYSALSSRFDSQVVAEIEVNGYGREVCPIIASNMKTIATVEMKAALAPLNVLVPAHRFQSIDDEVAFILAGNIHPNAGTVGLHDRARTDSVGDVSDVIFLELAHADTHDCVEEIKYIKGLFPRKTLIVGNVATADACKHLFTAGADVVKVGCGPGSLCVTRRVTGCGVPQLSAIMECASVGPIIGDGGIRESGDLVKCFAAGAKFAMVGALLSGTDEAAGEVIEQGGKYVKTYIGMASVDAGKVKPGCVPEGISAVVNYTGSAKKIVSDLLAGVRQGLAMVGARNLTELRERAVFQRISHSSIVESLPHIKLKS